MEIRDFSVRVDEATSVPPKLPTFRYGRVVRHEESDYESDYMASTTHVGTHMDAPYHFDPNGRTIGEIELTELIRPVSWVDVEELVEPNTPITLDQVQDRLGKEPRENEFLFIHTGWSDAHMKTTTFYKDNPYYTRDVCEYVVDRGLTGLITDTSVDPGDSGFPNHYHLLEHDKVIVENVVNCDDLPDTFTIYVVPMRIQHADGAPARVFMIND